MPAAVTVLAAASRAIAMGEKDFIVLVERCFVDVGKRRCGKQKGIKGDGFRKQEGREMSENEPGARSFIKGHHRSPNQPRTKQLQVA